MVRKMPAERGISKDSFYQSAPTRRHGPRLIGPWVQRRVAELYETGWHEREIAFGMQLPRDAVRDIIATYEYRAERFFRFTRGRK